MKNSHGERSASRLLRVEEVAHLLGVCTRTVWRLTSSGQLAKPLKIGRCRRWRREDLDDYIRSLGSN